MRATNITPLAFEDNLVRVVHDNDGAPWFVGKDVARALEYSDASNPSRLFAHVPQEWKGLKQIHTLGGDQEALALTEPGLYFFLGRSDKPKALPFQKWLAGEVLPTLRSKGSYTLPSTGEMTPPPLEALDMVSQLPEDVLCLPARVRDRGMHYALQMTRIMGGAGRDYILSVFVQCCRIIGNAGNDRQHGQRLPFENEDSRTFTLVQDFVQEMCAPCPSSRLRCMKLYSAFANWCEKRRQMDAPLLPSVIRFSRALERIPSVKKVSHNPYAVFAGLRLA